MVLRLLNTHLRLRRTRTSVHLWSEAGEVLLFTSSLPRLFFSHGEISRKKKIKPPRLYGRGN